jgi:hypothetical protein
MFKQEKIWRISEEENKVIKVNEPDIMYKIYDMALPTKGKCLRVKEQQRFYKL